MSLALALLAPAATAAAAAAAEGPAADGASNVPWWLFGVVAGVIVGVGVALLVVSQRKGAAAVEEHCPSCGKVMMADWPRCMFCKAPRGSKAASLEVTSGPLHGRSIPLEAEVTTIGSAPGATVLLNDAGVSRKHAGIKKADGGFELADLGSTNGVYVNGERVARRTLQGGDVIRVGSTEMVFKG